ncbi:hypothetical protein TYM08_P2615 [Marinicellulosiphila megalodicopiae]
MLVIIDVLNLRVFVVCEKYVDEFLFYFFRSSVDSLLLLKLKIQFYKVWFYKVWFYKVVFWFDLVIS